MATADSESPERTTTPSLVACRWGLRLGLCLFVALSCWPFALPWYLRPLLWRVLSWALSGPLLVVLSVGLYLVLGSLGPGLCGGFGGGGCGVLGRPGPGLGGCTAVDAG
jgi:hypothetical protein